MAFSYSSTLWKFWPSLFHNSPIFARFIWSFIIEYARVRTKDSVEIGLGEGAGNHPSTGSAPTFGIHGKVGTLLFQPQGTLRPTQRNDD